VHKTEGAASLYIVACTVEIALIKIHLRLRKQHWALNHAKKFTTDISHLQGTS
jgi:hypothetical protein